MGKFKMNGGGSTKRAEKIVETIVKEIDIDSLIEQISESLPNPTIINNITEIKTEADKIQLKDKRARKHSLLLSKVINSRLDETLSILEENNKITSLNFREIAMLIQQDRHVLQQLSDELQSVKNENTLLKQQLSTQVEITKELSSRKPEEIQIVTNNTEVKEVHSTLLYVIAGLSMLVNIFVLFNI